MRKVSLQYGKSLGENDQSHAMIVSDPSLHKSLKEFREAIVKSAIVSLSNEQGIITYVNQNFVHASGFTEDELVGHDYRMLSSGFHPSSFWKEMWATVSAGKVWRADVKNRAKDGSVFWVDLFVMPFIDDHDGTRKYLSIYHEITQRKIQEENIAELNQSLRDFQNAIQSSSIVSRADRAGVITYVNDNFVTISGHTQEELIGQNHRIINSGHHPKEFWLGMWETISSGKVWRADVKNRAKDGSCYWVDTFIMPFLDVNGEIKEFLSIRNNITNQKEQEEKIIELKNEQLAKMNHQMEKFLYSTSHDLRSPITSILGLINLMRLETKDATMLDYITKAEASTIRLDKIIKDIMSFSRSTYQRSISEKIDFETEAWKVLNAYKVDPAARRIAFDVAVKGTYPFFNDASRVMLIMDNVIRNAVHFFDVNKASPFIKVTINIEKERAVIDVHDNGIGIAKQHMSSIFNMFYKATHLSKGAGLGLFVVKETLEKLHGTIEIESEIGFGTAVRIIIPNDRKGKLISRKLELQKNTH
jgi:PAS domain S-box-containing protein